MPWQVVLREVEVELAQPVPQEADHCVPKGAGRQEDVQPVGVPSRIALAMERTDQGQLAVEVQLRRGCGQAGERMVSVEAAGRIVVAPQAREHTYLTAGLRKGEADRESLCEEALRATLAEGASLLLLLLVGVAAVHMHSRPRTEVVQEVADLLEVDPGET